MRLQPLASEVLDVLEHYIRRARAPNTRKAYASQWDRFAVWCECRGLCALPAAAEVVAAYLAHRARAGLSVASLNVALSAISFTHAAQGMAFDRRDATLTLAVAGIRRVHVRAQQQAAPLTADLLRQILAVPAAGALDRRDAALLALLYTFALRASEAVAMDWQRCGDGGGWLKVTVDHAEIVMLGSKAMRGTAEVIGLPAHATPAAMHAITNWVRHAGIEPGAPLLRPLTRGGGIRHDRMRVSSISGIVKRAIARHLLRMGMPSGQALAVAARYSGHSGRVGFCVSASEAGVSAHHVAAVARHASLAMVRRYAQQTNLVKCAPHLTPGVGV